MTGADGNGNHRFRRCDNVRTRAAVGIQAGIIEVSSQQAILAASPTVQLPRLGDGANGHPAHIEIDDGGKIFHLDRPSRISESPFLCCWMAQLVV